MKKASVSILSALVLLLALIPLYGEAEAGGPALSTWDDATMAMAVPAGPSPLQAEWRVCPAGPPDCHYITIQEAVDAAGAGDVVKVATGVYADLSYISGITQVVYITKSLTLQGGYTTANWDTPDPLANPTTLDAGGLGRGLYAAGPITLTVEGLRITGGDATGLGGSGPPYNDQDSGGGLFVVEAALTLSNCFIFSNTASTAGYFAYGGGMAYENGVAVLKGNIFQNNVANTAGGGYGGGLSVYTMPENPITLQDNQFISNTAGLGNSGNGGGLYLAGRHAPTLITLEGNLFQGNVGSENGGNVGGHGGGLDIDCAHVNAFNNTLRGNIASNNGPNSWGWGGGFLHGSSCSDNVVVLTANVIEDNVASVTGIGSGGGGVAISSAGLPIEYTLIGNTIRGNYSCQFGSSCVGQGGGMYAEGPGTLIDNSFLSNTASISGTAAGGGLYVWGHLTLTNNLFQDNVASVANQGRGGGLYFTHFGDDTRAVLSGNTFQGNVVNISDGMGCDGGGLILVGGISTLDANVIRDNSAPAGGGACVYWGWPDPGQSTWTNNVVVDNHLTGGSGLGSGIDIYGGNAPPGIPVDLSHTTLARNDGGPAVHARYSPVQFANTIVAGQIEGICNVNGAVTMTQTLWDGVVTPTIGPVTTVGDLVGQARFIPDGYHLSHRSEAVDQAIDAGVSTDVDRQVRPMRLAPDLGADELPYISVIEPGLGNTITFTDPQGLTGTLRVPPGAVTDVVTLTVALLPSPVHPLAAGQVFARHALEIEAYRDDVHLPGFAFAEPVTMSIRYSDDDVAGITEGSLGLYYWTGSAWEDGATTCQPPSSYLRNLPGNVLGLPFCHLCRYSMQGEGLTSVYLPVVVRNGE
ncbi:MAG: hypothetical protein JW900_10965 [Anaerolineae bacterium]|nr:hypothetical protein [Anaerolineae bacterium]